MKGKYYQIVDTIQIAACFIAFIAESLALYEYATSKQYFALYFLIGIIVLTIVLILLVARFWDLAIGRYKLYADILHQFNHMIRDETYTLFKHKNENSLTKEVLNLSLQNIGNESVNFLQNLLSKVTNNDISVHIKHFPDDGKADVYRTLCVSTNSNPERKTIHDHAISENTMMDRIVKGTENHFVSTDLKKTIALYESATQEHFKISYRNWEKWFNSIIVVPIRVRASLKDSKDKNSSEYIYLGFICCDAKERNAFRKSELIGHVDMIKAFADALYIYLDTISDYSKYLLVNRPMVEDKKHSFAEEPLSKPGLRTTPTC